MSVAKKITMKEIAEKCGVGKSTVSRYFNGGYVREETRQKIADVIARYNYEPNAFARLKAKESKMIGIIAPCLDSTVTSKVMMSIDRHLREAGYSTLIINTDHQEELELQYLERLWRMKVDGLILSATHLSEAHHRLLAQLDIPSSSWRSAMRKAYASSMTTTMAASSSAPTSENAATARSPVYVSIHGMRRSASCAARASWTACAKAAWKTSASI